MSKKKTQATTDSNVLVGLDAVNGFYTGSSLFSV